MNTFMFITQRTILQAELHNVIVATSSSAQINFNVFKPTEPNDTVSNIHKHKTNISRKIFKFWNTQYLNSSEELIRFIYYKFVVNWFYNLYAENTDAPSSKFNFLKNTINDLFLTDMHKKRFLDFFCKIQQIYRGMSRLAYIYKFKRARLQITADLMMNELSLNQSNVLTIYQNNRKYLFCVSDLVNMLNTALFNSPYSFSEPISCKNPYTNIIFNKSTLYNIYFFIKSRTSIVPILIHQYFMSNFDIIEFRNNNKQIILDHSILNIVNNSPASSLYPAVLDLIKKTNYNNTLQIDALFPKDKLVNIMRPYLLLYYRSVQAISHSNQQKFERILYYKMKQFILFNPMFGQKTSDISGKLTFNEKHIKEPKKISANFMTSHLSPIDNNYSDDDDDDEEDYNNNNNNYEYYYN